MMQTQATFQPRAIPIIAIALFVAFGLFTLMHTVITVSGHGVDKVESLPTIDFVRLRRDSQVEAMQRRKPPPPPPQPPPPPSKMKIDTGNVSAGSLAFSMPNVDLNASLGGGTFTGQMGGPGAGGMFDGDIIPLQRIPPQYPRDAARSGITGWVQLEVLVNADGTVRSARVLEAKPKGLFEAAAVQAVLRWKFKPKVVNGQPVQQKGAQRIEFNLNAPA
jgi:periplasmic protein TonB